MTGEIALSKIPPANILQYEIPLGKNPQGYYLFWLWILPVPVRVITYFGLVRLGWIFFGWFMSRVIIFVVSPPYTHTSVILQCIPGNYCRWILCTGGFLPRGILYRGIFAPGDFCLGEFYTGGFLPRGILYRYNPLAGRQFMQPTASLLNCSCIKRI